MSAENNMLKLEIIKKNKSESYTIPDRRVHCIAYTGNQSKIFLRKNKAKQFLAKGYLFVHIKAIAKNGCSLQEEAFFEKLQKISTKPNETILRISFPYETATGKMADILLAFDQDKKNPFVLSAATGFYYKIAGSVTEIPC